jgi:hypothetical protein
MIAVELKPGEGVRIGAHTVEVLAVRAGEVVVALHGPTGDNHAQRCPICRSRVSPGVPASEAWYCPRCGSAWDE